MRHFMLLCATLLIGCASGRKSVEREPAQTTGAWGYYSGPVDARWDADGRTMTLLNELCYTDPRGVVWSAPAGSVIDGASIPRALWTIMGGPFEGKYRNASVLHDVAYDQQTHPAAETDRMFYEAMRCSGVGAVEAKTMYYALLRFGRHWKFAVKRAKPLAPASAESLAEENAPRPTALEPGEVDAIHQWIRQNDPPLEQIKTQAAARRHWWQWGRKGAARWNG